MKINCITWNMAKKPNLSDLQRILSPDHLSSNILAIGLQESPSGTTHSILKSFLSLKTDLHFFQKATLWEIKLLLFCDNSVIKSIASHHSNTLATGLGNVIGNKGAVMLSLNLNNNFYIAFVNSHLPAHIERKEKRNEEFRTIVRAFNRLPDSKKHFPLLTRHHIVYWMGDLNYRISLSDKLDRNNERDSVAIFEMIAATIARMGEEEKEYVGLLKFDQLKNSQRENKAFSTFLEADIRFKPTFKFKNLRGLAYNPKQMPSYTDRVLMHVNYPRFLLKLLEYDSVSREGLEGSDHLPVYLHSEVAVAQEALSERASVLNVDKQFLLQFVQIKLNDATERRIYVKIKKGGILREKYITNVIYSNEKLKVFSSKLFSMQAVLDSTKAKYPELTLVEFQVFAVERSGVYFDEESNYIGSFSQAIPTAQSVTSSNEILKDGVVVGSVSSIWNSACFTCERADCLNGNSNVLYKYFLKHTPEPALSSPDRGPESIKTVAVRDFAVFYAKMMQKRKLMVQQLLSVYTEITGDLIFHLRTSMRFITVVFKDNGLKNAQVSFDSAIESVCQKIKNRVRRYEKLRENLCRNELATFQMLSLNLQKNNTETQSVLETYFA